MKIAQHPDNQQAVTACEDAPKFAICPYCGGTVILRQRKRMNGEIVYFWRHQDNLQRNCNGRSRSARA